ncbi:MAG: hypothetical protein ABL901_03200 [Hyphomicrobiaceae bacterium]
MRSYHPNQIGDDRYLLIDDTDEDATEILTVLCEGPRHSSRDFDCLRAYRQGGAE